MSASTPTTPDPASPADGAAAVVLRPRPWVPLGVLLLAGAPLGLLPLWRGFLWLAALIGLFAIFLLVQAATLRLEFDSEALLVKRNASLIRRFPYAEWLGWRLFWPPLPVIFYFREQKSIHFLAVLFDATTLRSELKRHLPHLAETASP